MANVTRHIGLSLGADICWPLCFEQILKRLKLSIPIGGDRIRFDVERLTIEPFDLAQPCKYAVVVDRLTHWFHTSREWIKKAVVMDDLYVFNNPWSVQSMEKQTSYCAMMKLGMPIPNTMLIPPKEYDNRDDDLQATLEQYARYFDLESIGEQVGKRSKEFGTLGMMLRDLLHFGLTGLRIDCVWQKERNIVFHRNDIGASTQATSCGGNQQDSCTSPNHSSFCTTN